MKRCILGLVLLILLGIGCLAADRAAAQTPERIEKAMVQAAVYAMAGDRQQTAALTERARAAWEKSRELQFWVRHEDQLHQIDQLFAWLQVFRGRETGRLYSGLCLQLRLRVQALADQDFLRSLLPER